MNYDLSFISCDGSDINNVIAYLGQMQVELRKSIKDLRENWMGLSFSKYEGLNDALIARYEQKIGELKDVIGLLNLIRKHNALRIERDSLQGKLSDLNGRLYHTEVNDEGEEVSVYNQDVAEEIELTQKRIEEINNQMDMVINSIKGITGG